MEKLSTTCKLSGQISGIGNLSGHISDAGGLKGDISSPTRGDYNRLINIPSINDVKLIGNKTSSDLGIPKIYYGTTEEWDSHIEIVSEIQAIYIYTDFKVESDVNLPAIKIGDGSTYLIDLPFITANTAGVEHIIESHIADSSIHVSPEDREFWNGKHKACVDVYETLSFTDL